MWLRAPIPLDVVGPGLLDDCSGGHCSGSFPTAVLSLSWPYRCLVVGGRSGGSPSPGTPEGVRWRRGEGLRPGSVAPEGAILLQLGTYGFTFRFSLEAETSGPVCTDPSKLPDCQRATPPDQGREPDETLSTKFVGLQERFEVQRAELDRLDRGGATGAPATNLQQGASRKARAFVFWCAGHGAQRHDWRRISSRSHRVLATVRRKPNGK